MQSANSEVRLRRITAADAETLVSWMTRPNSADSLQAIKKDYFRRPENWRALSQSEEAKNFFIIVLSETNKPIGISLLYDIDTSKQTGFGGTAIFDREELEKGYGFASKLLQLRYAFETLELKTAYSKVTSANDRIARGLKHLGYQELPSDGKKNLGEKSRGNVIFQLSRTSWEESRKARKFGS